MLLYQLRDTYVSASTIERERERERNDLMLNFLYVSLQCSDADWRVNQSRAL